MIMNYTKFSNENYNFGDCDIYAVALHRHYKYPLYSVRNYYPNGSYNKTDKEYEEYGIDSEDAHIVVKLPNGNFLDASGEMSEENLIKSCIFGNTIGEIKLVPISEDEALSIFGGCDYNIDDKIDDINYIISKL